MPQASRDAPVHITLALENKFREFEDQRKWRISLPAQIVIQQTLYSIMTDQLGLGDFTSPAQRHAALMGALEALIPFLNDLSTKAEEAKKADDEMRQIGAIFVLQHMKDWAAKFDCKCWPQ